VALTGGQPGNQNAAKGRIWANAINRALAHRSKASQKDAIDELAGILLDKCAEGDLAALKELGDRLDGKPHQSSDVALSGDLTIRPIDYSQAPKEGT
jgi:hypothetical protein